MGAWEDLFDDLPDYLVDVALKKLKRVEVGANEILMDVGDEDASMIYLIDGGVSVRRGDRQIDKSGPGEVLGEMAMFRKEPRVAQVRTTQPTRAFLIDREAYDELVHDNHPSVFRLERLVLQQLSERLRRLDRLVAESADGIADPYAPPPKNLLQRIVGLVQAPKIEIVEKPIPPIDILEASHLFRGERHTVLDGLCPFFQEVVYAPGQTLCDQGRPGDSFTIVGEGSADVYVHLSSGKIEKLGTCGPGTAVGMTALVDEGTRMATVIATEQVDGLEMSRSAFYGLFVRDGQIASGLRRAMIRAFSEQVDEAGATLVRVSGPAGAVQAKVETERYSG